ncbi:BQ5605_C008g05265 [Microbotryum silenes-dioicae]|uniref:BQ5605_C008g05265 protein n=1 Tax=Microbotryum silenes-dioicae TaxID=796604 RepID=A0A2X0MZM0_9BASI|nr:BQ5605_C008g05265 [Microbotryum silenes-dioicae]
MAPIKVAAIQASSCAYSLDESLEKLWTFTKEASDEGRAQLLVFPEAFLSAYPRHLAFAIGSRTYEQRDWYARYLESAVKIPPGAMGQRHGDQDRSETRDAPANDSDEFRASCPTIGIIERSLVGATLWCSKILVSPEGVVWSQGHAWNEDQQGSSLQVVDTPIGKIGGLICWETFMPLPRYALYQKGVEIWTAPTADARPTWAPAMQHIAQEGRCFCQAQAQAHLVVPLFPSHQPTNTISHPTTPRTIPPTPHPLEPPKRPKQKSGVAFLFYLIDFINSIISRGGSVIVDPLGTILAGPLWDKEGILYAEIDVSCIPGTKLDFDPVGHYAREDLFNFSVPTDHAPRGVETTGPD